jgi:hypothetical protein
VVESLDTGSKPYLLARVRRLAEPEGELRPGMAGSVRRALEVHLQVLAELDADLSELTESDELPFDAWGLSYAVARLASLPLPDRQALLSEADTAARLRAARSVLRRETELLRQLRAVPVTAASFRRLGPG